MHLLGRVPVCPPVRQLKPAALPPPVLSQRWLAYQLLLALAQCHGQGVCHGDIKPENVGLTSWDWAFLVDFAPYKPTLLPADNPADFSFFFDTSGRRRCYLAPERFVDPAAGLGAVAATASPLTPAMVRRRGRSGHHVSRIHRGVGLHSAAQQVQAVSCLPAGQRFTPPCSCIPLACLCPHQDVFSLGCVLAELFLDGQPLFDYSRLLAYRLGTGTGEAGGHRHAQPGRLFFLACCNNTSPLPCFRAAASALTLDGTLACVQGRPCRQR